LNSEKLLFLNEKFFKNFYPHYHDKLNYQIIYELNYDKEE